MKVAQDPLWVSSNLSVAIDLSNQIKGSVHVYVFVIAKDCEQTTIIGGPSAGAPSARPPVLKFLVPPLTIHLAACYMYWMAD